MQCPVDGAKLVTKKRAGVEIDYCPRCRGVWLDRGELDKIIARSAPAVATPGGRGETDRDDASGKRRGGFLDDLFDF